MANNVHNKNNDFNFIVGFLVGAFAGIAFGILYAPKRGKELRELLKNNPGRQGEKLQGAPETAV